MIESETFILPRQKKHSRNFIYKFIHSSETDFDELNDECIQMILDRSLSYAKELATSVGKYCTLLLFITDCH